ncbi:MAG: MMPL family transporter [Gaiellaceae bacterium]
MFATLARFVSGRRSKWVVAGVWLVLLVGLGSLGAKIKDVTDNDIALPGNSGSTQVKHLMTARFASGEIRDLLIVYSHSGGLTAADRRKIAADGAIPSRFPLLGRPQLPFRNGHPAPRQVSAQGDVAFTVVPLVAKGKYDVVPTLKKLRADLKQSGEAGLTVQVTGDPAFFSDITDTIQKSDKTLLLVTGLIVILLLSAVYGSPVLALVPLVVVFISYLIASGIIYLLAKAGALHVDTTSTSLLLVLMFGAGTDYCLLLVARYRRELRSTEDKHDAVDAALRNAGPAMLASGGTVALALLVMISSTLGVNHTFGPVNAIGITVVLIGSLTLMPAALAIVGRRAFWPTAARVAYTPGTDPNQPAPSALWSRIGSVVSRHPVRALVAGVLVLGVGACILVTYKTDSNPLLQFRHSTESTRGVKTLESRFAPGSLAPSTVLVERQGGPVTAADTAAVAAKARSVPGVAAVFDSGLRSRDGELAALVATFAAKPYSKPALRAVKDLRDALARPGPGLRVFVGQGNASRVDYDAGAKRDLKVSVPLVLVVVLVMLILLLRALVAPLFLLGAVLLSFAGSLGFSLAVIHLVSGQSTVDTELVVIVFIFLVALGSDYTIFLMSSVRDEARRHGTREGLLRGMRETGPVITSAGLILAGTFATLMVLPVWLLFEIGFTVALGVLLDTFLVRSLVVPSLTWLLDDRTWWPSRAGGDEPSEAPAVGTSPAS